MMDNEVKQKYLICEPYGKSMLHVQKPVKVEWLLLMFLTIITGGAWLFLTMYNIFASKRWTCTECGHKR